MLKIREKLADNEQRRIAREAKQAAAKADLMHKILQQGGPCLTADDVDALVVRFRNEKDTVLLNALKDQIRYQEMVLGQKGDLRLSGSIEELTLTGRGRAFLL